MSEVHGVFSNREKCLWRSQGQAIEVACLGSLLDNSDQQLTRGLLMSGAVLLIGGFS